MPSKQVFKLKRVKKPSGSRKGCVSRKDKAGKIRWYKKINIIQKGGDRMEKARRRVQLWIDDGDVNEKLDLSNLGLIELPPLPTSVRELDVSYNKLIELPRTLKNITYLDVSHNNLTNIQDSVLDSTVVDFFECSYNNLTKLPRLPDELVEFYCTNNNLKDFGSEHNEHIIAELVLGYNESGDNLSIFTLDDLDDIIEKMLYQGNDISDDVKIRILDKVNLKLQSQSNFDKLNNNDKIKIIIEETKNESYYERNVSKLTLQVGVFLDINPFKIMNIEINDDMGEITDIEYYEFYGDGLNTIEYDAGLSLNRLPKLPAKAMTDPYAYYIIDSIVKKWKKMGNVSEPLMFGELAIRSFPYKIPNEVQKLVIFLLEDLRELPELPKNLLELDCGENGFKKLPKLPETLIKFECQWNNLVELPQLPDTLKELYCKNNDLIKLPPLPDNLEYLDFSDNNITSVNQDVIDFINKKIEQGLEEEKIKDIYKNNPVENNINMLIEVNLQNSQSNVIGVEHVSQQERPWGFNITFNSNYETEPVPPFNNNNFNPVYLQETEKFNSKQKQEQYIIQNCATQKDIILLTDLIENNERGDTIGFIYKDNRNKLRIICHSRQTIQESINKLRVLTRWIQVKNDENTVAGFGFKPLHWVLDTSIGTKGAHQPELLIKEPTREKHNLEMFIFARDLQNVLTSPYILFLLAPMYNQKYRIGNLDGTYGQSELHGQVDTNNFIYGIRPVAFDNPPENIIKYGGKRKLKPKVKKVKKSKLIKQKSKKSKLIKQKSKKSK